MRQLWRVPAVTCVAFVGLLGCGGGWEDATGLETEKEALQACGVMAGNASLQPGQSIASCDGRFLFKLKQNGDLVLNKNGVTLWASHTNYDPTPPSECDPDTYPGFPTCGTLFPAKKGLVATMQADGNLVVYGQGFLCSPSACSLLNPNAALFASNTAGVPGARLVVQNDGNVVIYSPTGQPLWATHTHG
jgi:hypothetical protein